MDKRTLLIGVMILAGASSAFGQAAAESVMIHSMSAGAGAKAGSSLGRSTNNAASGLAGRLNSTMSGATSHHSASNTLVRPAPATSVAKPQAPCQAAESKQAVAPQVGQTQQGQTQAAATTRPNCPANVPSQAEQDKNKYKKFVTLTFDNK